MSALLGMAVMAVGDEPVVEMAALEARRRLQIPALRALPVPAERGVPNGPAGGTGGPGGIGNGTNGTDGVNPGECIH